MKSNHNNRHATKGSTGILKSGIISMASAALLLTLAPSTQAVGPVPNDLDGDGVPDFVFQDGNGRIASWLLDGSGNAVDFAMGRGARPGSRVMSTAALGDWKLKVTADVNGDHIPDFIFQNNAGQIAAWILDGTGNAVNFATGQGVKAPPKMISSAALGDWKLKAVQDLDGDHIPDFVFQNAAGQVAAWILDGTGNAVNFASGQGLKAPPKIISSVAIGDWKLKAMEDLDGDHIPDFVFQNDAGQVAAWILDGTGNAVNFATGQGVKAPPKMISSAALGDWKLKLVQDSDGDGIPDFVFQNKAGQIAAWVLDGTGNAVNFASGQGLKAPPKMIYSGFMGGFAIPGGN